MLVGRAGSASSTSGKVSNIPAYTRRHGNETLKSTTVLSNEESGSTMSLSKRAKRRLATIAAFAAALPIGLWVIDETTPSPVRQALPVTATDVREWCDASWQGDYARCLQAKMPQSEMPQFTAKLGLAERYSPRRDSALPVGFAIPDAVSWWHPPTALDGAYFTYKPGKEAYSIALYQNGCVYYLATAW